MAGDEEGREVAPGVGGGACNIRDEVITILHSLVLIVQAGNGASVPADTRDDLRSAAALLKRAVGGLNRRRDGGPVMTRPVLTARERAVARQLALGRAYKDIARDLNVGLSAVQAAVKTIYLKLGVHSREEVRAVFLETDPTVPVEVPTP